MEHLSKLGLSDAEMNKFVSETGFSALEAKGVVFIIDNILAEREARRIRDEEYERRERMNPSI